MGIDRHHEVMRHARVLREILPQSKRFALYLGRWAATPAVGQFEEALRALDCAFTGDCTQYDDVAPAEEYEARRLHVQLLSYFGREAEALPLLLGLLNGSDADFGVAFAYKETARRLHLDIRSLAGSEVSAELYRQVIAESKNQYTGFVVPNQNDAWAPQERRLCPDQVPAPPLASDFAAAVASREPLVIRTCGLSDALGWSVESWTVQFLVAKAGPVLVETETVRSEGDGSGAAEFGLGSNSIHRVRRFEDFLHGTQQGGDNEGSSYISDHLEAVDAFRPSPLIDQLRSDISIPAFLKYVLNDTNAVCSIAINGARHSQSRLRTESLDRLLIAARGRKRLVLFSPDRALMLGTMNPTFAVAPNGVSLQFVPQDGLHYAPDLKNRQVSSMKAVDVQVRNCNWHAKLI